MGRVNADLKVVVIGAGPAGLTAASELLKRNTNTVVCEKDDVVGGISRTVSYKGYRFDIGGHRFFTKVKAVENMWHEFMPTDFLHRSRESRIFYNNKFFNYPLKISNALSGLGLKTSTLVMCSYARYKFFPIKVEKSFEDYIINRFGSELYNIFFKTYTEKVWGIPCEKISAEWAAQRIKGLSLTSALNNALLGNRFKTKKTVIKTLIDSFHYPRFGPGMMWENVCDSVAEKGCDVRLNTDVVKINWNGVTRRVDSITTDSPSVEHCRIDGTDFICTMPVRELINKLSPAAPKAVVDAANQLRYRDFLTVALIIEREHLFSDNWIYIHEQSVKVGRIQNFKNWSPDMVPAPDKSCLGLEYFCFEGDGLWTMSDADLLELGKVELEKLGFAKKSEITDGAVVRMPKAYPVYDDTYSDALECIKTFLASNLSNIQLVGRNGMHKYNNQDHSMLTAMLAVENIYGKKHDLWKVNAEQEYHEELTEDGVDPAQLETTNQIIRTQPLVPRELHDSSVTNHNIYANLARLDKLCFALACGVTLGLAFFVLTTLLIPQSNSDVAKFFIRLNQFIPGYSYTISGAFLGALYGLGWGFIGGWLVAYLRNLVVAIFITNLVRKYESKKSSSIFDYM